VTGWRGTPASRYECVRRIELFLQLPGACRFE